MEDQNRRIFFKIQEPNLPNGENRGPKLQLNITLKSIIDIEPKRKRIFNICDLADNMHKKSTAASKIEYSTKPSTRKPTCKGNV
jgi:hypothetical protein